jgi:hypothetical protein
MLAAGGRTLLGSGDVRAAVDAASEALEERADWPKLPYRRLGRTEFEASRLIFGCGAALSRERNDALLNAAFEAGINVFDVGSRSFYNDAEENLAPFVKKVRDEIFLISKAKVDVGVEPDEQITAQQGKEAAAIWLQRLDESLKELNVDYVDAYYLMAANNPSLVASEEIHNAFRKAKQAGKVRHLGLSTHENAQRVLEAAAGTGWYSLAMIAITPGGWYDWGQKAILEGPGTMSQLQPFLARVRESGIGLVGMKAGRYLAGPRILGWSRPQAFDKYYDEKFLAAPLSNFQRSYAYVLGHGLDVVNADMQSLPHLHENVIAAATSAKYFA